MWKSSFLSFLPLFLSPSSSSCHQLHNSLLLSWHSSCSWWDSWAHWTHKKLTQHKKGNILLRIQWVRWAQLSCQDHARDGAGMQGKEWRRRQPTPCSSKIWLLDLARCNVKPYLNGRLQKSEKGHSITTTTVFYWLTYPPPLLQQLLWIIRS